MAACGSVAAAPANWSFDGLFGAWSGSGQVRYQSGDTEGIRCTAYYTGGGQETRVGDPVQERVQRHRDPRRPDASGREGVGHVGGAHLRCIGWASGRIAASRLNLSISGGGFSGTMSVSYSGARQTVAITTQGIPMKSVNVTLDQGLTAVSVPVGRLQPDPAMAQASFAGGPQSLQCLAILHAPDPLDRARRGRLVETTRLLEQIPTASGHPVFLHSATWSRISRPVVSSSM